MSRIHPHHEAYSSPREECPCINWCPMDKRKGIDYGWFMISLARPQSSKLKILMQPSSLPPFYLLDPVISEFCAMDDL